MTSGRGGCQNVFLNLPVSARSAQEQQRFQLGTVGAFAIDAASHHGTATIEFPSSEKLAEMDLSTASDLSVSLVRVNGANSPKGNVIKLAETIGGLHLQLLGSVDSPTSSSNSFLHPHPLCFKVATPGRYARQGR